MSEKKINVLHEDGKISIQSDVFSFKHLAGQKSWAVQTLDQKRFFLHQDEERESQRQAQDGVGQLPIAAFADFLSGLFHKRWSGVVSTENITGIKKIFFYQGEVVSAASSIIDDRLGEVVFRKGLISLDELADSTVRVTRNTRFGQVLLNQDLFSNVDLWQALKYQVQEILKSIFLGTSVFFELQSGIYPVPSCVVFTQNTLDIIEESFTYGAMFRNFCSRLTDDSQIVVNKDDKNSRRYSAGTFFGDLLSLIKDQTDIKTMLKTSKLIEAYTLDALMSLVNRGVCKINPIIEPNALSHNAILIPIKAKLDAYSYLLKVVKRSFEAENKSIPIQELKEFALSLNSENFVSFSIDNSAEFPKESLYNIFSQCLASLNRVNFFTIRIESVIQFLLQISVDHLSFESAQKIISGYRELEL